MVQLDGVCVSEPIHTFQITGDGEAKSWDFGVPVRYIEGIKDADDKTLPLKRYTQEPNGVTIDPPLAKGETVTVYFYSDFL